MGARRKTAARRPKRNSGRSVARKSGVKRTAKRRNYAAPKKRSGSRARRSVRAAGAPRSVRIVLETAGVSPVRAGEAVGVGQKVAKPPRLKPKF